MRVFEITRRKLHCYSLKSQLHQTVIEWRIVWFQLLDALLHISLMLLHVINLLSVDHSWLR